MMLHPTVLANVDLVSHIFKDLHALSLLPLVFEGVVPNHPASGRFLFQNLPKSKRNSPPPIFVSSGLLHFNVQLCGMFCGCLAKFSWKDHLSNPYPRYSMYAIITFRDVDLSVSSFKTYTSSRNASPSMENNLFFRGDWHRLRSLGQRLG